MTRFGTVRSMALVAMVFFALCTSHFVSAGHVSRSRRHAHIGVSRGLVAKRSDQGCSDGNGTLNSVVQDQIKKLESASAQQGGRDMTETFDMPGKGGNEHLQVEAKSDQNGQGRSWSWHWSSRSSSSSYSSSSSSSSDSSTSSSTDSSSKVSQRTSDNNNGYDAQLHRAQSSAGEGQAEHGDIPSPSEQIVHHSETKSSHTSHHSNTKEEHTTTTKDKDGKETSHTSTKQSSTSSSSSSYSHFSNVFKYVISGNSEASNNAAPFQNGHVQWTRSPTGAADFAVSQAINSPIARPARAETCNRRFPFTERQHTADDQDSRFAQPFPAEALDPVSKIALDLHNVERARYGLHPLQWNTELANMAACWADLKAYGHSEDHFCASGENIAMGLGDPCYSDPMEGMKNAIYSFLDEDRDWAKTRQMGSSTGHWVQAVWKDTRFLGCAVAQRKDFMQGYNDNDQASMYVVCEYYPPGNVLNQIRDQVPAVVRPTPQLRSSCSANERHS